MKLVGYTPKTKVVYQSLKELITEIETCGGSLGDDAPDLQGYQFNKSDEINMDARIDSPNKLELGCDEYSGASDRFNRMLGVPPPSDPSAE